MADAEGDVQTVDERLKAEVNDEEGEEVRYARKKVV